VTSLTLLGNPSLGLGNWEMSFFKDLIHV